jgi:hypothetical protein
VGTIRIQLVGVSTLDIRVITSRSFEEMCLCNKKINILATQCNNPAERTEFSSPMKGLMVCVCPCFMELNYCKWM